MMRKEGVLAVLVAAAVVACSVCVVAEQAAATTPNLSLVVSTATVREFVSKFVPQIEAGLQGTPISDVDTKQDGMEVQLTSMAVRSLTTSSVTITTGSNQVTVALNGVAVSLHGHYRIRENAIGHVTICSGDFDVSASGTSLSISISIAESGGVPVVSAGNTQFSLGDFDVKFCSAVGWLADLFKHTIKGKVEDAIKGQLASQINDIAKKEIAAISFTTVLTPALGVDYHLASGVAFSPTEGTVSILGSIFDPKTKQYSPYQAAPMNIPALSESVTVAVSEALPQGAVWSYFINGLLSHKIQGKSGLLKDFIVTANVTSLPIFSVTSAGAGVDLQGSLEVEFTPFPDYGFGIDFHLGLDVELLAYNNASGSFLYAQIPSVDLEDLKFDFILKNNSKLPFDEKWLLPFLNEVFKEVLNLSNPLLERTKFPLPSVKYLEIVDMQVAYNQGFVTVSTNLKPVTEDTLSAGQTARQHRGGRGHGGRARVSLDRARRIVGRRGHVKKEQFPLKVEH